MRFYVPSVDKAQKKALVAYMQFAKKIGENMSLKEYKFPASILHTLVSALTDSSRDQVCVYCYRVVYFQPPIQEDTLEVFNEKYMPNDDVRYYTIRALPSVIDSFTVAQKGKSEKAQKQERITFLTNLYVILHKLSMPNTNEEIKSFFVGSPDGLKCC